MLPPLDLHEAFSGELSWEVPWGWGVSPWGPVLTDRQQVSGRERWSSVGRYSKESLSAEVKGKRGIWGERGEGGERWGGRRLSDRALPHNPQVLSQVTK